MLLLPISPLGGGRTILAETEIESLFREGSCCTFHVGACEELWTPGVPLALCRLKDPGRERGGLRTAVFLSRQVLVGPASGEIDAVEPRSAPPSSEG